jgi:hypothetical protein
MAACRIIRFHAHCRRRMPPAVLAYAGACNALAPAEADISNILLHRPTMRIPGRRFSPSFECRIGAQICLVSSASMLHALPNDTNRS